MIIAKYSLNWNTNAQVWSNGTPQNLSWGVWKMNECAILNWSTSYMEIPNWTNLDFTSTYTFDILLKLNSLPSVWNLYNIYYRADTPWTWAQLEFLIYNNSWTHQIWISHNTAFYTINYTLPIEKWFNFNMKYEWWIIYLSIDWMIVWQVTAPTQPWSSNKTWCFWANNLVNIRHLNWSIDEIIIDNTAWTNTQIKNQSSYYNWFI